VSGRHAKAPRETGAILVTLRVDWPQPDLPTWTVGETARTPASSLFLGRAYTVTDVVWAQP
jgi:hypothetical protein